MIQFLRWTGRALLAICAIGLVGGGLILSWFVSQRAETFAELENGAEILSTAAGEIEVAFIGPKDGTPVLVLHGTPGGYDQALAIGAALAERGFFVIAPSRAGYLRTPLEAGFLFSEQADAMAAVLDAMEIEDAALIGLGAGAVVAMELAANHQGRVRGLVLISPPTLPIVTGPPGGFGDMNFLGARVIDVVGGDFGSFLAVRSLDSDPELAVRRVLELDTNLDDSGLDITSKSLANDPARLELVANLIRSIHPLSKRELGARNDILQLRHPQPLDLGAIVCPTLLISGALDRAGDSFDPAVILDGVMDARGEVVDGAGSLVWLGPEAPGLDATIATFIEDLPPSLPSE